MHFCITWAVFQQFRRRDVKLVLFFIIFHLLNYTSPLIPKLRGQMKQSLLWSRINAKKTSYRCSWQRIAICCVVTVDYGRSLFVSPQLKDRFFEAKHLFKRIKYRFAVCILSWRIQNRYREIDVSSPYFTEIMHVICTEWHMIIREIKLQKDTELKKFCKSPKIKDVLHENMISSWNIALTGVFFQSFSEQRCSFLAAYLVEKYLCWNLYFKQQQWLIVD